MTYIGRFAPTPSGPLHLGSLFTALASYLDAKHHQGQWLVRIEDLDTPRCLPGMATHILRTLETFGLYWDGPIIFQSDRTAFYEEQLEVFRKQGNALYPCTCTRRQLDKQGGGPYPGICRHKRPRHTQTLAATRWWLPPDPIRFEDRIMGTQTSIPALEIGDPVLRRKDGFFAYHWAVVMDDAAQNITDIVRGQDLLGQTNIHLCLQSAAKLPHPRYAHVPLVVSKDGRKLSKSERAASLKTANPGRLLARMLGQLGQLSPQQVVDRTDSTINEVLSDAILNWDISGVPKSTSLTAQVLLA